MRSSQFAFDFKNSCFICGKDADEKKENKIRKELRLKISHVCTLSFQNNFIDVAKARGDEWAKAVQKRVILNTDLVAAEVKYHQNCLNKFNLPVPREKNRVVLQMKMLQQQWRKFFLLLKTMKTPSLH